MSEKLRKVAEKLGYEVRVIHDGRTVTIPCDDRWGTHEEFCPESNYRQKDWLIEYAGEQGWYLTKVNNIWFVLAVGRTAQPDKVVADDESLAIALMQAIAGEEE